MTQRKLIMLCGVPTSGKSTFVNWYLNADTQRIFDTILVSSDYFIEQEAKRQALSYNDVFDSAVKNAVYMANRSVDFAISNRRDVLWDQTNLTPKDRARKLLRIPSDYKKIAVYFEIDRSQFEERNNQREGKIIPPPVIASMMQNYQRPSVDEGFDAVYSSEEFRINYPNI